MAVIPGVSDGELIRTTWGDAVADELNLRCIKTTGTQTMAGPLTVTGLITANNQIVISDTAPTLATHATRKDYVDTQIDANIAAQAVLTGGDTMTGMLTVGGNPLSARRGDARPDGQIVTGVGTTAPSLYLRRAGGGAGAGDHFIRFVTSTSTIAGSVAIVDASHVAYNTASDYRLKNELGDIDDPVGKLMALQPKHLSWKDSGTEFDGFIAHEVDAVVPYAVQRRQGCCVPGR